MKKKRKETISSILGFSQIEMAVILHISRAQWSMFQSGKRSLPTASLELLAEMLAYIKTPEAIAYRLTHTAKYKINAKKKLESLLTETNYQLTVATRKMEAMKKKQEGYINALQLTGFLASRAQSKITASPAILEALEFAATLNSKKNGARLSALETKENLLQKEKEVLEAFLKN